MTVTNVLPAAFPTDPRPELHRIGLLCGRTFDLATLLAASGALGKAFVGGTLHGLCTLAPASLCWCLIMARLQSRHQPATQYAKLTALWFRQS